MPARLTAITAWLARSAVALLVSFLLTACGGGGGDEPVSPPPTPSPPPPTTVNPTLSVEDAIVTEGDAGMVVISFTVNASAVVVAGDVIADASVDYATSADTASEGIDFEAATGSIDIPGGTTQVTIDINIVGDTDVEPNETFTITLSAPVNATLDDDTAIGTIRDDDSPAGASGLDVRPDNRTCTAPDRPTADASIRINDPYPALPNLIQPTKLLLEPGGARWFALQKPGQIVTFSTTNPANLTGYMDLSTTRDISTTNEGGLLGMAFHPDYPATPEIFVSYTTGGLPSTPTRSYISRMVLDLSLIHI